MAIVELPKECPSCCQRSIISMSGMSSLSLQIAMATLVMTELLSSRNKFAPATARGMAIFRDEQQYPSLHKPVTMSWSMFFSIRFSIINVIPPNIVKTPLKGPRVSISFSIIQSSAGLLPLVRQQWLPRQEKPWSNHG